MKPHLRADDNRLYPEGRELGTQQHRASGSFEARMGMIPEKGRERDRGLKYGIAAQDGDISRQCQSVNLARNNSRKVNNIKRLLD